MSNENAIEVRDMSKQFKRVFDKPTTLKERLVFWNRKKPEYHQVLNDINLDIKKGETVALIGTNGSGKSTLLKLMTKILYPTKGKLEAYGKMASLLELGAGFHPDFTGRENIYFNASIFGLTRAEIDKRVDEVIEFSELGGFIDNPVRTYSSGMYMRLAFSVAINVDADILLIDEILAVGDQHFQDKCFAKLEELRDSEKTIVIVSHSLDMIKKLCSRAIWIYKGNVRLDGTPETVVEKYLDQVATDHETHNNVMDANRVECVLTVETPVDQEKFVNIENLSMQGWEVSNVKNTVVTVTIDGQSVVANRVKRLDVMMHYQEACGGIAMNKEPGWECQIDVSKKTRVYPIVIAVSNADNDEVIAQREITINISNKV